MIVSFRIVTIIKMKIISMSTIDMVCIYIAELGEFSILLEILDLKKSIFVILILVLVAESVFGSIPFREGSNCVAFMTG